MSPHRVVIVGAGAAGLMAAIWAARAARTHPSGCEVLLLERTRDGGRKILISGGGRCNVLPSRLQPERFVTDSSPHTLRNLLLSWPLDGQIEFFEREVGLRLVLEEETGKLFPTSNHAKDVRDALVALVRAEGARIEFRRRVTDVRREGDRWRLEFADGPALDADAVVIATGGSSVPTTGSDGFGFALAERLGHRVVTPYPALTPLLGGELRHAALAGVSATVTLRAGSKGRHEDVVGGFLFTHRGFSGPAVLDLSHVVVRSNATSTLRARWIDDDAQVWIDRATTDAPTRPLLAEIRRHLPERLARCLLEDAGLDAGVRGAELGRAGRHALLETLLRWPLPVTGHEGYRKAEVTGGGVHLGEVDPRTLESRRAPGVYFCGEVLDAFGPIGGHNFAWAWATGRLAGLAAASTR